MTECVAELVAPSFLTLCYDRNVRFFPFGVMMTVDIFMDASSLVWCLAVDLCYCFHQLLDKGLMMKVRVFTDLITGSYFIVCMYHIFFIHSSVQGHLRCFQVLFITNNAAIKTVEQVSL
ncbi:hypothetical protein STEG23_032489 [Scotinomys teguina]